jgi:hypothetical protein
MNRKRTTVVMTLSMLLFTGIVGCSSPEDATAPTPLPERILVLSVDDGDGLNQCDDGECTPFVVTMCSLTNEGAALALVRLIEYQPEGIDDCEEREFRGSSGVAIFEVIDHIAGHRVTTPLEILDQSGMLRAAREDDTFLLYPRWLGDELVVGSVRRVAIGSSEFITAEYDDYPTIYDVPEEYGDFAVQALDYWENFEDRCPDRTRYPEEYSEEYEVWIRERPAHCGEEPQEHNQDEDEESEGENSITIENDDENLWN